MSQLTFTIPVEMDEDGYYDRECPSKECMFNFKVEGEDWTNLFQDEAVFCPRCGNSATSDSFWTTEQIEKAKEIAIPVAKRILIKEFQEYLPKAFKSKSTPPFRISHRNSYTRYLNIPIGASKEFEQKITCSECGARFSVIGIAYYCPCCGNRDVNKHFDDSIRKIEAKIKYVNVIQEIDGEISLDEAVTIQRSIIEGCLSDCVVAFQQFCEESYYKFPDAKEKIPFNVFQRIFDGNDLWLELLGEGYSNWLNEIEYSDFNLLFQRRHILAHKDGTVDEKYISKSNDTKYSVGQRIVVSRQDVLKLISIISKIVEQIRLHLKQEGSYD